MRRPAIVRLQLLALGLIVLLLVFRAMSGPPGPEGLLVFSEIEPHELRHDAFALDRPTRLAVDAVGSVDGTGGMAAYGWILERESGQVAWSLTPGGHKQEGSSLIHAQDTLTLPPGVYDVYFASYGNIPRDMHHHGFAYGVRSGNQWQRDTDEWMLALRSADGMTAELHRVGKAAPPSGPTFLWTAESVRKGQQRVFLFQADHPVTLEVNATGEAGGAAEHGGWIEDATTGRRVWEMGHANTEPAGGASLNRRFSGEIRLKPGLYRAVFEADEHHAYDGWAVNPPFDPNAWGMAIAAASPQDADAVHAFDPWTMRAPLVSILRVPSETRRSVTFDVGQPVTVVVDALGEIVHGERFDYGWLEDGSGKRVWDMSVERARPAGGADKNQEETAFLQLTPGTYRLAYQTDDSHAYDDWNSDPPDHPDRWGVALFPVSPNLQANAIRITGEHSAFPDNGDTWGGPGQTPPPPPLPPPAMAASTGKVLVQRLRLGNEANVQVPFALAAPTKLHVRATGEITPRGQFDYGWIEQQGTGRIAWEMKWNNTSPAGGDDRNRIFDGIIDLPPGAYVAHFQTDLSHAFPDFGDRAPRNPDDWGIIIERAE